MPLRRKSRRSSRRRSTRKARVENQLATRKTVKRMIANRIETKFYTNETAYSAITNSGLIIQLNEIGIGSDEGQRVGDSITMQRVDGFFRFRSGLVNTSVMRAIIFWWCMETPGGPAVTDILDSPNVGTQFAVSSVYNHRLHGRYKILYDKTFVLTTASTNNMTPSQLVVSVGGTPQIMFRKRIKLGNKKGVYTGSAGNSDMTKGALYLLFISDQDGATNPTWRPSAYFDYALYYKDA